MSVNPYNPTRYTERTICNSCGIKWRATYEQLAVFQPEIEIEKAKRNKWNLGRQDRLQGLPCRFANGAYLEGWYSIEQE